MSQPTLQYLIAEYLELNGAKTSAKLAVRFNHELQTMRANLRAMERGGFIESDGKRPQSWTLVKLPAKEKIVHKKFCKKEYRSRTMHCDGFYKPNLSTFATMPLVRIEAQV